MSDKSTGIVEIHGRDYITVAKRVSDFREQYKITDGWAIQTEIIDNNPEFISMKAIIINPDGKIIADGYVEEKRGVGVNKTSAMENAQTSAIGRALASCGFAGTEFASSDEMLQNLTEEAKHAGFDEGLSYGMACYKHKETIEEIQDRLADGDLHAAYEARLKLSNQDLMEIWRAPSKGGIFTTEERRIMKSDEFAQAGRELKDGQS